MNTQKLFIVSGLVAIVGVWAVWHFYRSGGETVPESAGAATTTTIMLPGGGNVVVSGQGSVTVSSVPEQGKGQVLPSFDASAPLVITTDMAPEAQSLLRSKFADAQKAIASKPNDYETLVYIGQLRKMAGDYAGAAAVWTYTAKIYPQDASVQDSLGSLYLDFLKNYPKAEGAYLSAVQNRKDDLNAYRALYSLYADYGYKATTNAGEQILKQGMAANPQAYDLRILLARYYVAHKNPTAAHAQYDAALDTLRTLGQNDLITQLTAEEAQL